MNELNLLGQPYPIPAVKSKNDLTRPEAGGVAVFVDKETAVQNLETMAAVSALTDMMAITGRLTAASRLFTL
jgi:hypothetical protein